MQIHFKNKNSKSNIQKFPEKKKTKSNGPRTLHLAEIKSASQVQILDTAGYVSLRANALGKYLDPSVLFQTMANCAR